MSHIYQLSDYGRMMADTVRNDAYMLAMQSAIKPDSVVIDLGCGPGMFSILACRMGARRVYAIEPSDAIQIARQAAQANGFADRIQFFNALSTQVSLPERADVLVSDLRGPLPYYEFHIPSIKDARQRLLSPSAVLIPKRDHLWGAMVNAADEHAKLVNPWSQNHYAVDFTPALDVLTNSWIKLRFKPEQLLTGPVRFHTVDYAEVESANLSATFSLPVNQTGVAHGLSLWFETELTDTVGFSNAPGGPELIYGNGFFFFPRAVDVVEGDRVDVTLSAHLHADYIWSWNTRILGGGTGEQVKADFKQSTFLGLPVSLQDMKKRAASHTPTLNESGSIYEFILSEMNGSTPLTSIATELVRRFPNRFADQSAALAEVADLSARYSE